MDSGNIILFAVIQVMASKNKRLERLLCVHFVVIEVASKDKDFVGLKDSSATPLVT